MQLGISQSGSCGWHYPSPRTYSQHLGRRRLTRRDDTGAQDHLIQSQIFEVAAIGEVDIPALIVGQAKGLGEQRSDSEFGIGSIIGTLSSSAWVAQPPAEPCIKQGQQEGYPGR